MTVFSEQHSKSETVSSESGGMASDGKKVRQPDVILLICDQMQFQRLGSGSPSLTPNLDVLAESGVTFERAFCSNAQCTPSRVSLQTGLYPHEAGVLVIYDFGGHTGHLGPRHHTVAQVFQSAGYSTALFGKSHFGYPMSELGYADGVERGWGPSLTDIDGAISTDAIEYIERQPTDDPLFLVVSWHRPHPPFEDVPEHLDRAKDEVTIPRSYYEDDLSTKPAFQSVRRDQPGGGYTEESLRNETAQYLSMIAGVDDEVGRVMAALEKRKSQQIVAFTSDHGDMMGAHGLRLKGPLPYDELYRVPLILNAPGIEPNTVIDSLTVNVSLPATLMDLASVPRPDEWPDRSLPIGTDDAPTGHIFMEHYGAYWGFHPFRMIRTDDYKLVHYYGPESGEKEFYDLKNDPDETTNRASDPAFAPVIDHLGGLLEDWWTQTGGRDWEYYESEEFREIDRSTLVSDGELWAGT